jgi:hypothetical protein
MKDVIQKYSVMDFGIYSSSGQEIYGLNKVLNPFVMATEGTDI